MRYYLPDYEPDYDAMWDEYVQLDEVAIFYATHDLIDAHFLGREVPNMGATDQPTRTTTTNVEPSAASAKPGESS